MNSKCHGWAFPLPSWRCDNGQQAAEIDEFITTLQNHYPVDTQHQRIKFHRARLL